MFSGKPRPTLPSKGALRVLYQLAYITSGTAAAVATLCAEEQRRRTVILQRIVDNTKRLRQDPKHVKNARRARVLAEGAAEYRPGTWNEEDAGEALLRSKAPKTSSLPSEVDRAYSNWDGRGPKRKKKRRKVEERQEQSHDCIEEKRPADLSLTPDKLPESMHRTASRPSDRKSIPVQRWQRPGGIWTGTVHPHSVASGPAPSLRKYGSDVAGQEPPFHGSGTIHDELLRAGHLEHAKIHSVSPPSILEFAESSLGVDLGNALELANVDELKRLVSGKLDTDMFCESDMKVLHQGSARLFDRLRWTDHDTLSDLYRSVFDGTYFRNLSLKPQISIALECTAPMKSWRMVENIIKGPISRALAADPRLVQREVSRVSETWLANEKHLNASNVLKAVAQIATDCENVDNQELFTHAMDRAFSVALASRDLGCCSGLLRRNLELNMRSTFVQLLEHVVTHATYIDCRSVLHSMLWFITPQLMAEYMERLQSWTQDLSEEARTALAAACIKLANIPLEFIGALYKSVPVKSLPSLKMSLCRYRLQALWRATKNFERVWAEFEEIKSYLDRMGIDSLSLELETTLVEICTQAKQLDRAVEILSRISIESSYSSRTLSIAAGILANRGVWDRLHEVLELMGRSGNRLGDALVSRNVNRVIYLYSMKHTLSQTWSFVANLIDHIGFQPTDGTNGIMLRLIVASRDMDLIPKWIWFLKCRGFNFKIGTFRAYEMFKTYYHEARPLHSPVMKMCRELVRNVPSFAVHVFRDRVREAIAYDLRKLEPRHRLRAEVNLARLLRSEWEIPDAVSYQEFLAYLRERQGVDVQLEPGLHHSPVMYSPFTGVDDPPSLNAQVEVQSAALDQYSPFTSADDRPSPTAQVEAQSAAPDQSQPSSKPLTSPVSGRDSPMKEALVQDLLPEQDPWQDEPEYGILDMDSSGFPQSVSTLSHPAVDFDRVWNCEPGLPSAAARRRHTERSMVLAFSRQHYQDVLSLYHLSSEPSGLPASRATLSLAVEASLRMHRGDPAHAEEMIKQAQEAGMNVTGAREPLILHQMWNLPQKDKKDAVRFRVAVIDYYQARESNGMPVQHYTCQTAANILINNGRADEAIELLNALYRSSWAIERPFDIVGMTIYMKAYASLQNEAGIKWVFEKIFAEDMRIDDKFLKTIKFVNARFGSVRHRLPLEQWRAECVLQKYRQTKRSVSMGWALMRTIIEAVKTQETGMDSSARKEMEIELFGEPEPRPLSHDATPEELESFWSQIPECYRRVAIGKDRRRKVRTWDDVHDLGWRERYRRFLEAGMRIDGEPAAFRYYMFSADELRGMKDNFYWDSEYMEAQEEAGGDGLADARKSSQVRRERGEVSDSV